MIAQKGQPPLTRIRRPTAIVGQILLHSARGNPVSQLQFQLVGDVLFAPCRVSQPPSSESTLGGSWAERVFLSAWTSSARTSGTLGDAIGLEYPALPPR